MQIGDRSIIDFNIRLDRAVSFFLRNWAFTIRFNFFNFLVSDPNLSGMFRTQPFRLTSTSSKSSLVMATVAILQYCISTALIFASCTLEVWLLRLCLYPPNRSLALCNGKSLRARVPGCSASVSIRVPAISIRRRKESIPLSPYLISWCVVLEPRTPK